MSDISKLYPGLQSAPAQSADMLEEGLVYRLKKIKEIEQCLRREIKERDKLSKKFKMHAIWVRYRDHGLLGITIVTLGVGIGALASGLGVPICIAMGGITIAVGVGQAGLRNAGRRLGVKAKKHEAIRLLAESKLNSIIDLISKEVENGVISDYEFSLIMQEKQRYMILKEQLRQRAKRVIDHINERERAQLVAKGREEGRSDVLKKLQSAQYASGI